MSTPQQEADISIILMNSQTSKTCFNSTRTRLDSSSPQASVSTYRQQWWLIKTTLYKQTILLPPSRGIKITNYAICLATHGLKSLLTAWQTWLSVHRFPAWFKPTGHTYFRRCRNGTCHKFVRHVFELFPNFIVHLLHTTSCHVSVTHVPKFPKTDN